MRRLTIQFRLTAWYFVSVAVVVTLFAAGSGFAMRAYMYRVIDRDLRFQMARIVPFIETQSLNGRALFSKSLMNAADASIVGAFVQISDDQKNLLFMSDVLLAHKVPLLAPGGPEGSVTLTTVDTPDWPMRVATSHLIVAGTGLNLHVLQPLHDVQSYLRAYMLSLTVLVPIALFMTTTIGYWMSRRALRPVEQIRRDAESIDPADLTARLPVPPSDDELTRLARTLNAMLSRIETGFRAVQQFTADASHELRAPLSLITTAADVSLRRERTREEMAEALRKILGEARHMSGLVENLLALARGDARVNSEFEPLDLAAMLRDVAAECVPLADAKRLALNCAVTDREVRVRGGGVELRRLLLILVDNAIKYTETGAITLSLACAGQNVEIAVADTGIGIEPSGLPHVFDRFWRADKVRSRSEGGTGLGLSIAQQIVHRHGGSISVRSQPGRGSTFTVLLNREGSDTAGVL